jgi:hypothetical protein
MKYTFIIVVKMFVCSATCVILVAYARIYIYNTTSRVIFTVPKSWYDLSTKCLQDFSVKLFTISFTTVHSRVSA